MCIRDRNNGTWAIANGGKKLGMATRHWQIDGGNGVIAIGRGLKGSAGIIGACANYFRRFSRIAKVGIFIGIGVFFQEKKPSISD